MKAVCIHNCGNDFDLEVGETMELKDLYITGLIRNGSIVDLSDPQRPGYLRPESEILALLKKGDEIEENYCHGRYRIV